MKIAIMSDSHDRWDHLSSAIDRANQQNCTYLLFAGDLIAPPGIEILEKFNGQVKFVWGNNEAEMMGMTRRMDASDKIELCGNVFEGELDGYRVFMNHFPRISELAAKSSEFDLCIHGHTHIFRQEKMGECMLVNPGEIQGYKTGQATFIIFDTQTSLVEKISL